MDSTSHMTRPFSPMLARLLCWASFSIGLIIIGMGCTRNPYAPPGANWQTAAGYPPVPAMGQAPVATGPASVYAQQQTTPQIVELQRRIQQLDDNNRQLTTQLAQAQQQVQVTADRERLVAQQLQDLVQQNKQLLAANQQATEQARGMQASMNMRGGARLTANNSLAGSAANVRIPGAEVLPDGDLIRIRLPSDQLFSPGTAQLNPTGANQLDQVAGAIVRNFSRQRIAVEGHTDANQSNGGYGTPHQLSGTQAQAVMDQLIRRGGVPMQQLFVVAHGSNHPLADPRTPAGQAANRRIEIVVYPDTY